MFSSDIVFAPDPIPAGELAQGIFLMSATQSRSVSLVFTAIMSGRVVVAHIYSLTEPRLFE